MLLLWETFVGRNVFKKHRVRVERKLLDHLRKHLKYVIRTILRRRRGKVYCAGAPAKTNLASLNSG